ncbi:flagellar hook-associated protein FlgL [Aneurinibacillus aneurinilyticus]|uniref:flagellar hook-associated protein FlgL n=1 Tax=Aneurinibacillus aneurinilyticus TaxID=1391 RepID=UPI002E1CA4E3|nr:flagellar hook-associated protein FlgL [Aneurinibacillus aneurinilyticus]MED0670827.1 flagellar hook-associated protein FlgL [Aneurinibacillus aneurinilyticus]
MRITQNMLNDNMLYNLGKGLSRMDRLQDMMSTGKKISKPSHDPMVAIRGMLFRTKLSENEQYRANTDEAANWLDQAESSIGEAGSILARIKDLITQAATDTNGVSEREKISAEVRQLREQLGTVANTTFAGKYIFSGTQTLTPPYNGTNIDSGINEEPINLEVSTNIQVQINVTAKELFGEVPNSTFNMLDKVISHLESDPAVTDELKADLDEVQKHIDNLLKVRASVGGRTNRIELMQDRLDTQHDGTEKMISDGEDANLARVIMDLMNNENVYRSALGAGARIIQPSLLDFLR